jgi:hypothetical protein
MTSETYIAKRDVLIPKAEAYANAVCGHTPSSKSKREEWGTRWNEVYHRKMKSLAIKAGLTEGKDPLYQNSGDIHA